MTITRFRKGTLSVPKLYCSDVDTLSGNLELKRAGSTRVTIANTVIQPLVDLSLAAGVGVKDASGTIVLGTDDLAHIDELGRIDATVTSASKSETVYAVPANCCSKSQSGAIDEVNGAWNVVGSDILHMFLGGVLPYQRLKGTVKIEAMRMYITSSAAGGYITDVTIVEYNPADGSSNNIWNDATDVGNGTTGFTSQAYAPNLTLNADRHYTIKTTATIGAGTLNVYAFEIEWQLV